MQQVSAIDTYIATFPDEVQKLLKKLRNIISAAIPNATEGISYGIPTLYLNGKYLVYFAAFKHHISVYPATTPAVDKVKGLVDYKVSKGTLKFPLDKPIPFDLIKEFVKYRVKEHKNEFPKIGAPALRALDSIGITRISELTKYTEKELLALHGLGPKALRLLQERLSEKKLAFAKK